ncbi:MAG: hypothetical protein C0402_02515 [Thermodesulfovibrio sp.]|nr:hypothetical protein [Thermodesulfovibrio sp.]
MDFHLYAQLKETALQASCRLGNPLFYARHEQELSLSSAYFEASSTISRCLQFLDEAKLHPAHGILHCEKVAREAGAILLIERQERGLLDTDRGAMLLSVQIAGLLHDIRRSEADHPVAGSREAERILRDFDLEAQYKRYIVAAIRNHEAFKKVLSSADEPALLVSDCLYDADKFRWGPDNFTQTLWLITESFQIPLRKLYQDFEEKLEGINRISETFRTDTGRRYGPEFVELGLKIGKEIYREMRSIMELT